MLIEPAEANDYRLEQVEIGTRDALDFSISDSTLRAFVDLLALGGTDRLKADALLDGGLHLPNLLALLLFSTSVGVSLPGSSATFLEFSAECARPIALRRQYRLEGTVAHRSMATRIVKKALVVRESGADAPASVTGKVATLVNKPGRAMPTISELKEAATDRGLAGKVVLITGASRGIGETTAKLFALNGSRVVVNYHRGSEDAARVAREITDAGGEAVAIAADVADPGQVRALVDATMEQYGAIHVLVNNAARDYRPIPFLKLTWDEVQKDLDVVARGAFLCCQQVIPIMLAQGGGKIVSISSVAVDDPPADQTKYVMAKSALVGLTRSLSIEFASRNIQANLVVPNFVETDLVAHIQDGFRRKIAQETPMRRHGSPVEVAQAVVFLASAHASFTTGQKIMVTGGGAPYL
jgi:3-oxoacyl-[acyl-carrier protein] reductase